MKNATYEDGLRRAADIARELLDHWQARAGEMGKSSAAERSARDHYYGRVMGAGAIEAAINEELGPQQTQDG